MTSSLIKPMNKTKYNGNNIGYSSDTFSEFQATLDCKGETLGKLNIPQEGTANFETIIPWLLRNVSPPVHSSHS